MRIEDREEFIDRIAQAVIDRIEEQDRISGLVHLITARVLALQKEQAAAHAALGNLDSDAPAANGHKQAAELVATE